MCLLLVVDNYDVLIALGDGQNLKLTVVDTAGQEEFRNIRALSYGGTHVVIICYSCDSKASLNNVKALWLPEIRQVDKGKLLKCSLYDFFTETA